MDTCTTLKELQFFVNRMLSIVQEILDKINKLLLLLSKSNIFCPQISSDGVISRNRDLRQLVRQTILLLQDDLLKACESLGNYGTNKEMYREIRREISRKETRQLKQFLDVCTKRLNNTKDSYNGFRKVTKGLLKEIDKAKRECEKVLKEKETTPSYSRIGLGVGLIGLTVVGGAAVVAFSPIAAPVLALAGTGAGGFSGALAGIYMYLKPNDDDINIIKGAHAELGQLSSILDSIQECANKCASLIETSAGNLGSTGVIGLRETQEDNLTRVNIPECFGLDNNQLKELTEFEAGLNFALDEFEKNMKILLAGTTDARTNTEECIKKFPGA